MKMLQWFKKAHKEIINEFPENPEVGDVFEKKRNQYYIYDSERFGWLPYSYCVKCGEQMIGFSRSMFKKCPHCTFDFITIPPPPRPPKEDKCRKYFRIMGVK